MNEDQAKRLQGMMEELKKILNDAFVESIGGLVVEATNDDHIPLDMLGKIITTILLRRLHNTSERPIEVFRRQGLPRLEPSAVNSTSRSRKQTDRMASCRAFP